MSRDSRYAATEDLLAKIDDVVSGHEQQRSPELAMVLDDDLPEVLRYRSTERDGDASVRSTLDTAYRRPALGTWTVVAPEPGNEYVDRVSGRCYRGTEDGRWELVDDVAAIVDHAEASSDQIDSFAMAFDALSDRPLRIEADGTFSGYVSPSLASLFQPIASPLFPPLRPSPFLAPALEASRRQAEWQYAVMDSFRGAAIDAFAAIAEVFTSFADNILAVLSRLAPADLTAYGVDKRTVKALAAAGLLRPYVPVPRKPSDRRYVRRRR